MKKHWKIRGAMGGLCFNCMSQPVVNQDLIQGAFGAEVYPKFGNCAHKDGGEFGGSYG